MMSTEQLNEEQARLAANLDQVQQKIAKQWFTDDVQNFLTENKRKHDEMMTQSRRDVETLQTTLQQLKGQAKNNEQAIEERMTTLRSMRTELEAIEQDTDTVLREKELAAAQLTQTEGDIGKEKELLSAQENATQQRLVELEKSEEWFRERLGLKFKKLTGGRLQIIFTCINPNPQKQDNQFFFSVSISTETRNYIISDCQPEVPDLQQLVDKLNSTNNLRSFIIEMRKRFKALAAS